MEINASLVQINSVIIELSINKIQKEKLTWSSNSMQHKQVRQGGQQVQPLNYSAPQLSAEGAP